MMTYEYLCELERSGKSEAEIASDIGMSRYGLYKLRKRNGWSKVCGRSDKGKARVDPELSRLKRNAYMREYQRKNRQKIWRKHVRDGGRVVTRARLIVERVLGRPLRRGEVVHHIDGDQTNDVKSNLLVCDRSYHMFLHIRMLERKEGGVWGKWGYKSGRMKVSDMYSEEELAAMEGEFEGMLSGLFEGRV